MILNPDQCYQGLLARDARFDGRYFVAVKTTRIYCRPICRVKPPLRKNCSFYGHAAEAEVAGYRPCKLCRPELAPGSSTMEISSQLARATASFINQDFLADHSLEELAERVGVTDRQMRRVFRDEFGVSPIEYWQTQRLLLAKQLLTDSRLPVSSVALASGFQSLRRFNVALKEHYRMTPTELRKRHAKHAAENTSEFSFRLSYRPPFDWDHLLGFLARRAIPQVEAVRDGAYFRTVRVTRHEQDYTGFLEVRNDPDKRMISVRVSDRLVPVTAMILERIKRLFDLEADPAAINPVLGFLAEKRPGLRVPGSFDGFALGPLRDAAVLRDTVRRLKRRDDPAPPPLETNAPRGALRQARTQLRAADGAMRKLLASEWDGRGLEAGLRRLYKRSRRAMHQARKSGSDDDLHAWRRRLKDIYYALKVLPKGGRTRARIKRIKLLTSCLGDDHDLAFLERHVSSRASGNTQSALLRRAAKRRRPLQKKAFKEGRNLLHRKPRAFAQHVLA